MGSVGRPSTFRMQDDSIKFKELLLVYSKHSSKCTNSSLSVLDSTVKNIFVNLRSFHFLNVSGNKGITDSFWTH